MKRSRVGRLVLVLVLLGIPAVAASLGPRSDADEMADAASRFLSALSSDQRSRAAFAFDSDDRMRFHFIPNEMFPRAGVMLKEMDVTQRERAHDLLKVALSQSGYMTTLQIMKLEDVLLAIENGGRFARDDEEYFVSVFGTPGSDDGWGWRFEGHHLSFHFTVVAGSIVASAPAFMGSNPAEVLTGPDRGLRVLADKEDAARTLLGSLTADQQTVAIVTDVAPRDIVTGAELDIEPLGPVGIAASAMTGVQRGNLMRLIEEYTSVMADDIANHRMERLRDAGLEQITFAWAGAMERGEPHYYRVQGPTFLIEYDNTQNDANHIHSVWREFDGDFGRDLLREHLRNTPH